MADTAHRRRAPGPLQFARYAFPPNTLGYCGPPDHQAMLEYADAGVTDGGLIDLARRFDGAWPYLETIARANGIEDPLDAAVVEAYWVGSPLLDRVTPAALAAVTERFRTRLGTDWGSLIEAVPAGAVPHHSFHVLAVYPWLGLLREGNAGAPLEVMDRCRIRWGGILELEGDQATVLSRRLKWRDNRLSLGPPQVETVTTGHDGYSLTKNLHVGDWVSMHWHWVSERLTRSRLRTLQDYTRRTLRIVNALPTSGLVRAGY